jgi:hypothetical protein
VALQQADPASEDCSSNLDTVLHAAQWASLRPATGKQGAWLNSS